MKRDHEDPSISVAVDTRTYNVMLNGLADRGRAAARIGDRTMLLPLENMYLDMLRRGLRPDGFTYSVMLKGCDSDAERCTLYLENMLKQVREESEERREERREEERGEKGRRGGGVDGGSRFTSSSSSRWLTKRDVDVCLKQLSDVVGREEVNVLLRKNANVMEEL